MTTVNDSQATVKRLLSKIADSRKNLVLPLKSQYGECSSSRAVDGVECKRFITVVKQGRHVPHAHVYVCVQIRTLTVVWSW
jgi:hypothetical protein